MLGLNRYGYLDHFLLRRPSSQSNAYWALLGMGGNDIISIGGSALFIGEGVERFCTWSVGDEGGGDGSCTWDVDEGGGELTNTLTYSCTWDVEGIGDGGGGGGLCTWDVEGIGEMGSVMPKMTRDHIRGLGGLERSSTSLGAGEGVGDGTPCDMRKISISTKSMKSDNMSSSQLDTELSVSSSLLRGFSIEIC